MFPTVEVRWFYKGTVPPQVAAWFDKVGQEPSELAERTDYYLYLGDGDALGIKLREGRIEIKQRQRQFGPTTFHDRVTGMVEQWHKWSFALAGSADPLGEMPIPTGSWIGVQKVRRLRRYHLAGDQRREIKAATGWPVQGCHFELTELVVEEQVWWSVCLEVFGAKSTFQQTLAFVAGHIMTRNQPPLLDVNNSYGYPRWLEMIRCS